MTFSFWTWTGLTYPGGVNVCMPNGAYVQPLPPTDSEAAKNANIDGQFEAAALKIFHVNKTCEAIKDLYSIN